MKMKLGVYGEREQLQNSFIAYRIDGGIALVNDTEVTTSSIQ